MSSVLVSSKRAQSFEGNLNISAEINKNVLKLTVDSLNLGLCDSRDYLLSFKSKRKVFSQ